MLIKKNSWLHRVLLQPDEALKDMEKASKFFCDVLPIQVTKNLLKERLKKAKKNCVDEFLRKTRLDATEVQKTIDNIGISRDAYNQIFQLVQKKLKEAKATTLLLPQPSFMMKKARQKVDDRILNLLGANLFISLVYIKGKRKQKGTMSSTTSSLI